jgi:hypothetical protein
MFRVTFCSCLFLSFFHVSAGEPDSASHWLKQRPFVSATYLRGRPLATNDFISGDNLKGQPISEHEGLVFKMGWQNPGLKNWQRIYRLPYYGIGFYMGHYFTPELGQPRAGFGFIGLPVYRGQRFELNTEFQFGMTWNWNKYDPELNPKNIAIGGGMTVWTNAGFKVYYKLCDFIDLGAGFGFQHFSNGGFERPNRGINMLGAALEMRIWPMSKPNPKEFSPHERAERSNEWHLMLGYGNHQIVEHELDTNYFAAAGLSLFYLFRHTTGFSSGPGIDFNFFWALTAKEDGTHGPIGWNNLTVGLCYLPEMRIEKLILTGGIGIYARHSIYGNFMKPYQRLGARWMFDQHWSLGVNIRSIHFILAEFLEFNLSYSIKTGKARK